MLPEMLALAAEVFAADPAHVASTDRAAEMASTAAVASTSAAACQRIGRNARAPHRHGGNSSRPSVPGQADGACISSLCA
jgi:hypothetical protein